MAEIKEIAKFQADFDKDHGWVDQFERDDDKFFERLQYATIALTGEVGEFSNFLKKILREKKLNGEIDAAFMASMKEELIDIFIYLIILSLILDVDVEKEYYEKMQFNEKKYKKFKQR